jgi:integrase
MSKPFPGVFRRGRTFWLRHTVRGRQVRVSLETDSEALAIARAAAMRATPVLADNAGWRAEVDAYIRDRQSTGSLSRQYARSRKIILEAQGRDMGWENPARLTPEIVAEWYRGLRATKAEATASHYLVALRSFLNWCVEKKLVRTNAAAGVKQSKVRTMRRDHFLPAASVRKLIDACKRDDLKFVLYAGFLCGLRRGEICNALTSWIDLDQGLLRVRIRPQGTFGIDDPGWRPKFGRERVVPLPREFRTWLAGRLDYDGFVLHPEKKNGSLDEKYRWDFKRPWLELLAETKIKSTIHQMRRTFASHKATAGVSLFKIAKWLGNSVAVVEKHYAHLVPDESGDVERGLY